MTIYEALRSYRLARQEKLAAKIAKLEAIESPSPAQQKKLADAREEAATNRRGGVKSLLQHHPYEFSPEEVEHAMFLYSLPNLGLQSFSIEFVVGQLSSHLLRSQVLTDVITLIAGRKEVRDADKA